MPLSGRYSHTRSDVAPATVPSASVQVIGRAPTWTGTVALIDLLRTYGASVLRRDRPVSASFVGFRFPPEVILLAVRWYLRYGLSYRDIEELLAERGVDVDHVTVYRWVQRFTPLVIDAARPCRHSVGDRWFVDET